MNPSDFPGYNTDPKVRKIVDRCNGMGRTLQRKNGKPYQYSTLRANSCKVRDSLGYSWYPKNPGVSHFKIHVPADSLHRAQSGGAGDYTNDPLYIAYVSLYPGSPIPRDILSTVKARAL